MKRALVVTCLCLAANVDAAGKPVDWSAGQVSVRAVGVADLRMPGVDIARVASERTAAARVAAKLRETVRALPVAAGGTVGKLCDEDKELGTALDAVLAGARPRFDYQSDGSVVAFAELPVARVAEVILKQPAVEGDPTALVVDARKLGLKPAVGYRVEAGALVRAAPVFFVASPEDARAKAPRLDARATAVKKGVVALALDEKLLAEPRRLIVLLVTEGKP